MLFNQIRNIYGKSLCKNYIRIQLNKNIYKHINNKSNELMTNEQYNKNTTTTNPTSSTELKPARPAPSIGHKYDIFKDDSVVILDVEEERLKLSEQHHKPADIPKDDSHIYAGLNLTRGITGVFEIKDLVEVLKRNNADDIFVCSISKQLKYVDYMCIVTGRSYRHMLGIAQFVRKMYKLKCHEKDVLPKLEGEKSNQWIALDLGNIVLHIFASHIREKYDLESLWSCGAEYDTEVNKPTNNIIDLYERHSIYLKDLTPKTNV